MSEFEGHTPGPWIRGKGAAFGRSIFCGPLSKNTPAQVTGADDKGGRMICEVGDDCGEMSRSELAANARLIAAAPELLAENARLRAALESALQVGAMLASLQDKPIDEWVAVAKAGGAALEGGGNGE